MEKLELTLYQFSIDELEEYRSLLKEGNRILGLEVNSYEERIEYLVGFAITQALKAEREHLADLKREVEENKMEKKTVRDLVFETSHQTFILSSALINLEVIQGAVAQLMERIDEITYKNWDEDPAMARLFIGEIKDKVRLIDMAFNPLYCSLSKDVKKLETQSSKLFDIIVKQRETEDTKKAHSVAPE